MILKPCPIYSFVAPGLLVSQCKAIARHPQLLACASAFIMSFFAIPFRRFWKSKWLGYSTFQVEYPNLFTIAQDPNQVITTYMEGANWS
ncbi:hypothetical protein H5410_022054 [Solanum commersonii]|uniref:Uncharacterized protein n=1 Tax=Solanum commersonii TaxID=4109 RepID=A0A9J5ZEB0_SOLCO|nr:hypothetical protein H5410_022054 [Solanum commersonii]